MKIMIAGDAGYVGSVLVPLLLEHGYEVQGTDIINSFTTMPMSTEILRASVHQNHSQLKAPKP